MSTAIKKICGIFLIGTGSAVLVHFIGYTLYAGPGGLVDQVWVVLNWLMAVGMVSAVWLNGERKCRAGGV